MKKTSKVDRTKQPSTLTNHYSIPCIHKSWDGTRMRQG